MAGLLPQEAPVEAGANVSPEQQDQTGEQPNVSPEEQAQYDQFMDNAFSLIYDEQMNETILKRLQDDDFVAALANVAFMVISRLEDSAKQNGSPISEDVLFQGGIEIIEDIANLAKEAGLHEYSEDEMEAALMKTLDLYGENKKGTGELNTDQLTQDFAGLIEAQKSGKLEQMFPGLSERYSKGGQPNV